MLRIDDVSEVIKVDNSSVAKGHNVQVLADGFDDRAAGLSHGSNNGLAVIGENGVEGRTNFFMRIILPLAYSVIPYQL